MQNEETKRERLFRVVSEVKTALINSWETNSKKTFTDKNHLSDEGILPKSIGLTGLLLLLVGFSKESSSFQQDDIQKVCEITEHSLNAIFNSVEKNGYTVDPIIDIEESDELFSKDGYGYIDSMTWILSLCVLSFHANKHINYFTLNESTLIKVKRTTADILHRIISSQHDGTWGFTDNPNSERSLYFTYCVGSALADVYDYLFGELTGTVKETEYIEELQEEISSYKGNYEDGLEKKLDEARDKLSKWLVEFCLPQVHKLASCIDYPNLSTIKQYEKVLQDGKVVEKEREEYIDLKEKIQANDSFKKQLGIFKQKMPDDFRDENPNVNYFHLYYVYYLIDLLILCNTDKYYRSNYASKQKIDELLKNYHDEKFITKFDKQYYDKYYKDHFSKHKVEYVDIEQKTNEEKDEILYKIEHHHLWDNFLKQAIQVSRNFYIDASHTGKDFWDGEKSELQIKWQEDVTNANETVIEFFGKDRIVMKLKEPAIIPLALRANINYSYYISNRTDVIVDDLYNEVLNNRYEDETKGKRINNLWDDSNYNLLITERSIEALVDYYDYLNKFEPLEKPKIKEDTDIEKAIKNIVLEYLETEVKTIIKSSLKDIKINTAQLDTKVNGTYINDLCVEILTYKNNYNPNDYNNEGKIIQLFDLLYECSTRRKIAKHLGDSTGNDQDITKYYTLLQTAFDDWLEILIEDFKAGSKVDFANLYKKVVVKQGG